MRFEFLHDEDIERGPEIKAPVELVILEPYLRVEYEVNSRTVRGSWMNYVVSEARLPGRISDWTTVEVLVKPKTAEMQLVTTSSEGQSAYGDLKMFAGPLFAPDPTPLPRISVGPKNNSSRVLTLLTVVEQKAPSGLIRSRRDPYIYERGNNVSVINFEGRNGFVRYDFRNRIKLPRSNAEVGNEEVALDFEIKPGVTSGLLWFAEGAASKSFVIIKVSRWMSEVVYFIYGVKNAMNFSEVTSVSA